jgi:DNA-binding NtrC family response regulator
MRVQVDVEDAERLCLHDYREGNVRELENLAAVVCARMLEGELAAAALRAALEHCLPGLRSEGADDGSGASPSAYERHRAEITAAYHESGGNLSRLEEVLRSRGLGFSRRWLSVFLERWGVRRKRARRRE